MITDEQEKVIVIAEQAIKNNPTHFEHYIELGWAYFQAEQLNEAMAAFQRAVALNPSAAGAFNGIGRVYERLGPAQAALEAYEHAIALDPQGIAPYVGLGIIYFDQLFDYEAAIKVFQSGLEHHPEDAFAVALLGITYARTGRFDEAIFSLQQAIRLQPDDTFAYGNLSILYLHRKQYAEMIGICERELQIVDGPNARRLLGIVYDRLDRPQEAIHQLEQSITLNPQDYEARGLLAKILHTVGRKQEAEEHYAIAREMAAQDNEYGQACFEAVSGNLDRALPLLAVALTKKQVQPGWARIDPELFTLTDDPRFGALLEQ
jgi:tetratricopeptide (TPR) repeat protein